MHWVHGWWTMVKSQGPPWTGGGTDRKSPGHGSALTGVGPLATSERRSSLAGVEHGVPVAGLTRARVVVWWSGNDVEETQWWLCLSFGRGVKERGWVH
jgi:hypothetical protein